MNYVLIKFDSLHYEENIRYENNLIKKFIQFKIHVSKFY